MSPLFLVVLWVLPSVLVGVWVGHHIATSLAASKEQETAQQERQSMLQTLLELLKYNEKMAADVGSRNTALAQVGRKVEELPAADGFESVQHEVLQQIALVIQMNKRLEDDLVCAKYQIEEQAEELDRTRLEARTDPLSGTYNRKAFDEAMTYLLSNFKREKDGFALVMCDVDRFKWINDTHGHAAGDKVVCNLGEILKLAVRGEDYVARFGGDEFALLLRHADIAAAAAVANRVRQSVERRNFDAGTDGNRIAVTLSMGLAVAQEGDTISALVERADRALYESKHQGRNQLHSCAPTGELQKVE